MSALAVGIRTAALRVVAAPSAVFLAVLTAGLAASSTARYTGVFASSGANSTPPSVVLACPRTRASASARASASTAPTVPCRKFASRSESAGAAAESRPMTASDENRGAAKPGELKAAGGGGGASMPLPDFRTPAMTRFTSPL